METIFSHTSGTQYASTNATYNAQWSSIANSYDTSVSSYATAPNQGTQAGVNILAYTYYLAMNTDPTYFSGDLWTDLVDIKTITKVEMQVSTGCSDNDKGNKAGYMYHQLYFNSAWSDKYTIGVPDGSSVSLTSRYIDITSLKTVWTLNDIKALRTRFLGKARCVLYDDGKGDVRTIWATTFYAAFFGYRITWDWRKSKSALFAFNW